MSDRHQTWPYIEAVTDDDVASCVRIRAHRPTTDPGPVGTYPEHTWEVRRSPEYRGWREADCRRCGKSILLPDGLGDDAALAANTIGVHPDCNVGIVEGVLDE